MSRRPSQPRPGLAAKSRGTPVRGRPPRSGPGDGLGAAAVGADFEDAADATEVGVISSDLLLEPDRSEATDRHPVPRPRGMAGEGTGREVELGAADTLIRSPRSEPVSVPPRRLTLPKPADFDPNPTAPPGLRLPKPEPLSSSSSVSVTPAVPRVAGETPRRPAPPPPLERTTPQRPLAERAAPPPPRAGMEELGQTLDRIQEEAESAPAKIPQFDRRFVMRQLEEEVSPPIPFTLRELILTIAFFLCVLAVGVIKGPSLGILSAQDAEIREREVQQRVLRDRLREEVEAKRKRNERERAEYRAKLAAGLREQTEKTRAAVAAQVPPKEELPPPRSQQDRQAKQDQTEGSDQALEGSALESEGAAPVPPSAEVEPEAEPEPELEPELATTDSAEAGAPPAVEPSGLVTIMSEPPGAILVINGRVMGKTPFINKVEGLGGRLSVELKRRGYRTWKGKVGLNEAGHYHLKAALKKR